MHAQYSSDEELDAQYSIHRICQAYQLAKFINLIGHSFTGSTSRDLLILAGDLNTDSNELPYRLLVSMTNLTDSYGKYVNHGVCDLNDYKNSIITAKYFMEDADLITCGHRSNTFTTDDSGKRIDYIMYKLIQQQCDEDSTTGETIDHFYCVSDRVECHGKDVDAGLSFSDHQPVAIQVKLQSKLLESELKSSVSSVYSAETGIDTNSTNSKSNGGSGDGCLLSKPSTYDSTSPLCESHSCERPVDSSECVMRVHASESPTLRQRVKPNSHISAEVSQCGHNSVNNIPPELKKQAVAVISKLYPLNKSKLMDKLNSTRNENLYLRRAHQLIESYLSSNLKRKRRSLIIFLMIMLMLVVAVTLAGTYVNASVTQMSLGWSAVAAGGLFFFLVMEIIYRFEQNAITGVFEDMEYMLDFVDYH
ncbi:neutral sphingomyelinase-like protein [Leptotrombidium deliense]|uniref:Neutral sphingomyelinase-like protein n=1 Tax=Leptotrombidium deliense TaxID=299467 RepID=A0A443SCJ8_9ACAR|nr:neutral sphingomyelinase-like protein [Leptotrombidium deliense]